MCDRIATVKSVSAAFRLASGFLLATCLPGQTVFTLSPVSLPGARKDPLIQQVPNGTGYLFTTGPARLAFAIEGRFASLARWEGPGGTPWVDTWSCGVCSAGWAENKNPAQNPSGECPNQEAYVTSYHFGGDFLSPGRELPIEPRFTQGEVLTRTGPTSVRLTTKNSSKFYVIRPQDILLVLVAPQEKPVPVNVPTTISAKDKQLMRGLAVPDVKAMFTALSPNWIVGNTPCPSGRFSFPCRSFKERPPADVRDYPKALKNIAVQIDSDPTSGTATDVYADLIATVTGICQSDSPGLVLPSNYIHWQTLVATPCEGDKQVRIKAKIVMRYFSDSGWSVNWIKGGAGYDKP